ncbi:hypothetical protein FJ937_17180 [Mesorhizobium sp. B2-4-4]|uniref:DUF6074 family protein n=1 Tax=Mesorhizobium sp. B2-4-4 TaxID=2589945 RepID=UPI00112601ED|nr:DUF6074 family protein [Mesorhizobium sp. B2-4-4]TPL49212.1 hypothetical protein FJ937_17180 [Mesorhizobium sp. B2-4-4]
MAEVICFPMRRRLGKIRRTVEMLSARNGRAADHYWRQTVAGLVAQLCRAGLAEFEVRREVHAFSAAVQKELQRGLRRNDGDAA